MNTHIVIMAGGIGSRFWPMSTPEYPKQFIDVMGCGKSLIQLTRRAICTAMPNGKLLGSDQREIYGYCKRTVARFARMQHPGRADCP